jgi:hypothetical protein
VYNDRLFAGTILSNQVLQACLELLNLAVDLPGLAAKL